MHVHGDHNAGSCFAKAYDLRVTLGHEDGATLNREKVTIRSAVKQPTIQDFSRVMLRAKRPDRCGVQFVETRGISGTRLTNLDAG